jgi:hypothetical protein
MASIVIIRVATVPGSTVVEMRYQLKKGAVGAPRQQSYYFHKLGDHIRDTHYGSWRGG